MGRFVKRTWLARLGEGLNKFIIGEKDANGKQTLVNSPDSVTQQGDVISAPNMNDLEDRILEGFQATRLYGYATMASITGVSFTNGITTVEGTFPNFPADRRIVSGRLQDYFMENNIYPVYYQDRYALAGERYTSNGNFRINFVNLDNTARVCDLILTVNLVVSEVGV